MPTGGWFYCIYLPVYPFYYFYPRIKEILFCFELHGQWGPLLSIRICSAMELALFLDKYLTGASCSVPIHLVHAPKLDAENELFIAIQIYVKIYS